MWKVNAFFALLAVAFIYGTILLDEIGEIPMPVQAKLLRVLEEGQGEGRGGS